MLSKTFSFIINKIKSNRSLRILIALSVVITLLLEPIFSIYIINESNWRVIVLVKSIANIITFVLVIYEITQTLRNYKYYSAKKLLTVIILPFIAIYLILNSFNNCKDLIYGESNYTGICEISTDSSYRLPLTTFRVDFLRRTFDEYQLKRDDYIYIKESSSGSTCAKDYNFKYLQHYGSVLKVV